MFLLLAVAVWYYGLPKVLLLVCFFMALMEYGVDE